jgi:hypothetical protein
MLKTAHGASRHSLSIYLFRPYQYSQHSLHVYVYSIRVWFDWNSIPLSLYSFIMFSMPFCSIYTCVCPEREREFERERAKRRSSQEYSLFSRPQFSPLGGVKELPDTAVRYLSPSRKRHLQWTHLCRHGCLNHHSKFVVLELGQSIAKCTRQLLQS